MVVDGSLPQDATLAERSRALRKAYPFGPRRCWPYKAWLKERRRYLVQHIRSIEAVYKLLPIERYIKGLD